MTTFYRIHPAGESIETLRSDARKDGWVASDENGATQPMGISACMSLEELRRYVVHYSMAVQPGDVLVRMVGRMSPDRDRDMNAVRCVGVTEVESLGDASEWLATEED